MTEKRIRVLMAIPGFDGHWRGSAVVTRALRDAGMEVIYMGQQQPETIVSAAIDEDVDVIGLSIYAAGHMRLIKRVMNALGKQEGKDIMVLVGGVIPYPDIPRIKEMGVEEVFPPGSPTDRIVDLLVEFLKKGLEPSMHGFEVVERHPILGNIPGLINSRLRFKDLRVPVENVLGKVDGGFPVMTDELAIERSLFAAMLVGNAKPAFELAVKYSYERKQFGVPLRQFEAISFRIADMAAKLEAMRLLIYHIIRMIDEGLPAEKASAMAKFYASEACFDITHDALQITGSKGISADKGFYMAEYLFRIARLSMIPTGTNEIQKYIVQREIYREYKRKLKNKAV